MRIIAHALITRRSQVQILPPLFDVIRLRPATYGWLFPCPGGPKSTRGACLSLPGLADHFTGSQNARLGVHRRCTSMRSEVRRSKDIQAAQLCLRINIGLDLSHFLLRSLNMRRDGWRRPPPPGARVGTQTPAGGGALASRPTRALSYGQRDGFERYRA